MLISSCYPQKATYWTGRTDTGYGGYSYGAPTVIDVRWEERQEEVVSGGGEIVVSHAVVFTENRLEEGGYLYLGESSEADPTSVKDVNGLEVAYPIRRISSIPSLDAEFFENKAFL